MKQTRHIPEQIFRKLKTAEHLIAQGTLVVDVCLALEVSQPTYHCWHHLYVGMQAEEAKRLTQLEKENQFLKRPLAEAELENAMLYPQAGEAVGAGRGKLLCPERRRRAVDAMRALFRVYERIACRVVCHHRSTQRHGVRVVDIEEATLRRRLRDIAAEHIRWARRMAYRLLRQEGWLVNHKRVHRLWREKGLQRITLRKQKWARPADGSVRRHQAEHPHQVWAMDIQSVTTADDRRLKFLNVIDNHTRLCLGIGVDRRFRAKVVMAVAEELTSPYPAPTFVRSDNRPELIAHALRRWGEKTETTTAYIEP